MPTGKTDLVLICHGQSSRRDGDRLVGWWADTPLSEVGLRQMLMLGERLRNEFYFDRLYTSPLRRARETAETLAYLLKVVPREVAGLRELDAGVLAHLSYEDAARRFPDLVIHGTFGPEDRIPGGESYADLHRRVEQAFDWILKDAAGCTSLVVTHGGPVTAGLRAFLGYAMADVNRPAFQCDIASLHHLQVDEETGERTVVRLNDTSHLAGMPEPASS